MAEAAERELGIGMLCEDPLSSPFQVDIATQQIVQDILQCYVLATRYDPEWYKAWHTWALANVDYVSYLESQSADNGMHGPPPIVFNHAVQAIDGNILALINHTEDTDYKHDRFVPVYFIAQSRRTSGHAEVADTLVQIWLQ